MHKNFITTTVATGHGLYGMGKTWIVITCNRCTKDFEVRGTYEYCRNARNDFIDNHSCPVEIQQKERLEKCQQQQS